jgi:hypothetical protein
VLAALAVSFFVSLAWWVAAASACTNEALRSELHSGQLPDCRAYERVSPAFMESGVLTSEFAVSPEGSHVIASSFGAFANAEHVGVNVEGHVLGAAYLFSRTSVGWAAAALGPPVSENEGVGNMVDASAALDASLWELNTQSQSGEVRQLYLERPLGTFTKVGATVSAASEEGVLDYHYLGASEYLSRVLFSTFPQVRWPFDGTVSEGGTLYEYTGVEQPNTEPRQPVLVGVEGGRGSTALISHCGTRLGSNSFEETARENEGLAVVRGSVYNAISASGARVFFTAVGSEEAGGGCEGPRVGELFAREEQPQVSGELPPAGMRTVAISEPSAEDCGACLTSEASRSPAVFQGASLDGSHVFFTTEQELLPGAQGNNLYEYDFDAPAGERITLLSAAADPEVQGVARISEDGSHVYFVARGRLTDGPREGCLSELSPVELKEEETTHEGGCRAKQAADNLYVYAEGRVSFVATLAPEDEADWARVDTRPVQASGEGRFLVFTSVADLTHEGVASGKPQVFQYDAKAGTLVRASIGQDDFDDNNREPAVGATIAPSFPRAYSYAEVDSPTMASSVQAPADGAVFFESPDALTSQALSDQNDFLGQPVPNIYEYRAGHVYLLSDGHDISSVEASSSTVLAGSDPSGSDVFFLTADPLIPADANTQQDLYDARVEGGFPTSTPATSCAEGETCQGARAPAPALATLGGSATQAAETEIPAVGSAPAAATPKPKTVKRKKRSKPKTRHAAKTRRSAVGVTRRGRRHRSAR